MDNLRIYWYALLYFLGIWKMPESKEESLEGVKKSDTKYGEVKPKFDYITNDVIANNPDVIRFLEAAIISDPNETLVEFLKRHTGDVGLLNSAERCLELTQSTTLRPPYIHKNDISSCNTLPNFMESMTLEYELRNT